MSLINTARANPLKLLLLPPEWNGCNVRLDFSGLLRNAVSQGPTSRGQDYFCFSHNDSKGQRAGLTMDDLMGAAMTVQRSEGG